MSSASVLVQELTLAVQMLALECIFDGVTDAQINRTRGLTLQGLV